jgi:hypothetical protein
VRVHDAAGDEQAQTGPAFVGSPILFEDVRQVGLADSTACVGNRQLDGIVVLLCRQGDAASGRGELESVGDQIGEDLDDAIAIGGDDSLDRDLIVLERDLAVACGSRK